MKVNNRAVLQHCIEMGISLGIGRAKKHTNNPTNEDLVYHIDNEIWLAIDEFYTFEDDHACS